MTVDLQLAHTTAHAAARAAGEVLLRGFGSAHLDSESKSHRHDPVTVYDRLADEAVRREISAVFPEHGFLSEELGRTGDASTPTWVIDPLDGTNNYLRRIPHFAVSIALRSEGRRLAACVYDPIRKETFAALRGRQATLNGSPISVSRQIGLDGIVVAVGLSYRAEARRATLDLLPALIEPARALRTTGSASLDLAYVAAGRFDVAWYPALSEWDIAAGALLIQEAGGRLTDLVGEDLVYPEHGLVASNGRVHDAFLQALHQESA